MDIIKRKCLLSDSHKKRRLDEQGGRADRLLRVISGILPELHTWRISRYFEILTSFHEMKGKMFTLHMSLKQVVYSYLNGKNMFSLDESCGGSKCK